MKYIKLYVIAIFFTLFGCSFGIADEDSKYYQMASALTKLSSAVEATVRYEELPDNVIPDEIILQSTSHDRSLLAPFNGYKIKVYVEDRHAIVLVCNLLKEIAYLEDAGCSAELDIHHWKSEVIKSCSATLSLAQACN